MNENEDNDVVHLHEYWGSGACGLSFIGMSPMLSEFLIDAKVLKENQFIVIQSAELTPDDGILFQYDIHHYFPVIEGEEDIDIEL